MVARLTTGRSGVLAKRMPGDLSEYSVIQTRANGGRRAGGAYRRFIETGRTADPRTRPDGGGPLLRCRQISGLNLNEPSRAPRGRIQLTDAIAELAKKQSVDAMLMTGQGKL